MYNTREGKTQKISDPRGPSGGGAYTAGALRGPSRGAPAEGRRSPSAPACASAGQACGLFLTLLGSNAGIIDRESKTARVPYLFQHTEIAAATRG